MGLTNQSWNKAFFAGAGYGDNWDPTKNPISIGFAPGYALQSRELLELQTILAYQTSTTNRCLFKHGQPRVDLEFESLVDGTKSPITRSGTGQTEILNVYKNAEFFCNFQTQVDEIDWIPTGFWLTFPPYISDDGLNKLTLPLNNVNNNAVFGFNVDIRVVSGDPNTGQKDQFGNVYDYRDFAGEAFANNFAIGAGRLVYEITNQNTSPTAVKEPSVIKIIGDGPTPPLDAGTVPSNDGYLYRGFVPIGKKLSDNVFVFAYDETVSIPTE